MVERSTTLRADCFELIDQNGVVRARMSCGSGGEPALTFLDRQGRSRLRIYVDADGAAGLSVHSDEDRPVV
jgi:hypothetical protein